MKPPDQMNNQPKKIKIKIWSNKTKHFVLAENEFQVNLNGNIEENIDTVMMRGLGKRNMFVCVRNWGL